MGNGQHTVCAASRAGGAKSGVNQFEKLIRRPRRRRVIGRSAASARPITPRCPYPMSTTACGLFGSNTIGANDMRAIVMQMVCVMVMMAAVLPTARWELVPGVPSGAQPMKLRALVVQGAAVIGVVSKHATPFALATTAPMEHRVAGRWWQGAG